jgi:hypothetical protein
MEGPAADDAVEHALRIGEIETLLDGLTGGAMTAGLRGARPGAGPRARGRQ